MEQQNRKGNRTQSDLNDTQPYRCLYGQNIHLLPAGSDDGDRDDDEDDTHS